MPGCGLGVGPWADPSVARHRAPRPAQRLAQARLWGHREPSPTGGKQAPSWRQRQWGGRQRAHLQAPRAGWAGWPRGRSFQVRGPGQGGVRPGTWRREGTDGCQGRAVHQHARLYQGAAQKRRDPQATGCAWCADGKTQKQKAKQKSLKTARTAPWAAEAAARRKVSKRTSDVPATFL